MEPRKVIGSVSTSEFVVTLAASAGFLAALGLGGIQWQIVVGLLVGGVIVAPFAAIPLFVDRYHEKWIDQFYRGFLRLAKAHRVILAGGLTP